MAGFEEEKKRKAITEQQDALSDYLDALFREMPEDESEDNMPSAMEAATDNHPEPISSAPKESIPEPRYTPPEPEKPIATPREEPAVDYIDIPPEVAFDEDKPLPQLIENHLIRQLEALAKVESDLEEPKSKPVEPVVTPKIEPKVEVPEVVSRVEPEPQAIEKPEALPLYQPEKAFQVLFFSIGKLNLAIPLEHLSGIIKVGEERVAAVPGYTDWHLGLMKHQETTVNIVDTAKLIVPKHRRDVVEDRRSYRYYILLDERRWGLGCHAVAEVETLEPSEVKWRAERKLQPWLAGTVIERMCALIDVEGFLRMLSEYQRREKP